MLHCFTSSLFCLWLTASRGRSIQSMSLTLYLAPRVANSKAVAAAGIPKTTSHGEPEGAAETDGLQQAYSNCLEARDGEQADTNHHNQGRSSCKLKQTGLTFVREALPDKICALLLCKDNVRPKSHFHCLHANR